MVNLEEDEINEIIVAAENILRLIGYAQGRSDSYAARRDELKVIMFPTKKEEREEKRKNTVSLKSALKFSRKEIKKMPEQFQKIITIELEIPVRKKKNGTYEARFRRYGFNICVSSTDRGKLKDKFFNALLNYRTKEEVSERAPHAPYFEEVAARWLELRRPTIKENTAEFYEGLFRANLFPAFAGREITVIRQSDVLSVINGYLNDGKPRTAVKVYQTLKAIFDFAVGDELLEKSPMRLLKPPKYEEKNGCALTVEEERGFLDLLAASNCADDVKGALMFLLYTGIRRSELATARIEEGFISVVCAKVRKGFQERRRLIPITPMLAPHIDGVKLGKLRMVRPDALTQAFKRLMPSHHLHELRHTFITRCQELGVPREVVSVWAGHAADNTQTSNVYTHFSREFMLKEAQKILY